MLLPPNFSNPVLTRHNLKNSTFFDDLSHLVLSSSKDLDKDHPAPHHFNYAHRREFESDSNNQDMYESSTNSSYSSHNNYPIVTHQRPLSPHPDDQSRYLSDSPSPIDPHPQHSSSFPHPLSAPHTQDHFSAQQLQPPSSFQSDVDRFSPFAVSDRFIRAGQQSNTFPQHGPQLDHRRMSEPALFGSSGSSPYALSSGRYQQVPFAYNPPMPAHRSSPYVHTLQRGISTGSLRDLNEQQQQQLEYSSQPGWKQEDDNAGGSGLDEPISPLHPTFSGGASGSPPLGLGGLQYPTIAEDPYGPSPPGTGTSTSSAAPNLTHNAPTANTSKTYAFVSLPGNAVKKRPRRRYDEIERLYQCSWPDCAKAYGTLNHLNAHVTMQKHGSKRSPNEFKELRKQWRKAKKEETDASRTPGTGRRVSARRESEPDLQAYARDRDYTNHRLSLGLPTSATVPMSLEDIRFPPPDELEGQDSEDGYARQQAQRYAGAPASWHQGMTVPSSSLSPTSRSIQAQYQAQPRQQHANLAISIPGSNSTAAPLPSPVGLGGRDMPMSRLPPDSTLLTPLPGYEPPANIQFGYSVYGDDDGVHYTDDGRPSTGHSMYGDDMRPGTGHASLGGGSVEGEYDL